MLSYLKKYKSTFALRVLTTINSNNFKLVYSQYYHIISAYEFYNPNCSDLQSLTIETKWNLKRRDIILEKWPSFLSNLSSDTKKCKMRHCKSFCNSIFPDSHVIQFTSIRHAIYKKNTSRDLLNKSMTGDIRYRWYRKYISLPLSIHFKAGTTNRRERRKINTRQSRGVKAKMV